jgi:hypothetical protein
MPIQFFVHNQNALGHIENATESQHPASTAVMVAGAGSTGGILAVCVAKFRKIFRANRLGVFQKTKEK